MFDEWLKMAVGLIVIALLATFVVGGIEMIIPFVVVGGVIFMLFHAAKGFAQADQTRHNRRRKGR